MWPFGVTCPAASLPTHSFWQLQLSVVISSAHFLQAAQNAVIWRCSIFNHERGVSRNFMTTEGCGQRESILLASGVLRVLVWRGWARDPVLELCLLFPWL